MTFGLLGSFAIARSKINQDEIKRTHELLGIFFEHKTMKIGPVFKSENLHNFLAMNDFEPAEAEDGFIGEYPQNIREEIEKIAKEGGILLSVPNTSDNIKIRNNYSAFEVWKKR